MKKFNQYLLTHYPLIWNLKLIYTLPAALLIHLGFYIGGRIQPVDIKDLSQPYILRIDESIGLSILISLLFVILWLIYYLRNNAFKSYYPLKKGRLTAEFLLMMVVFFANSAYFLTYQQGKYDAVKHLSRDIDLEAEINLSNQAMMFIPTREDDYKHYNCCDSIEAREARREAYDKEREERIELAGEEGHYLELPTFDANTSSYDMLDTNADKYLYYCRLQYGGEGTVILDRRQISERGKSWLLEDRKDSVLQCLKSFDQLLTKYGVSRRWDYALHAKEIFENNFEIDTLFETYDDSHWEEDVRILHAYLDPYDVGQVFSNVSDSRRGFWKFEILLAMLYFSLGAAIILLSYRLVKLRLWFSALVAFGVLTILFGLLVSVSDIKDEGVFYLYFFLFGIVLVLTLNWIKTKRMKRLSSVGLLWVMWNLTALVPLFYGLMREWYNISYNSPGYEDSMEAWLRHHEMHMAWLNIPWTICVISLIWIPLIRKWHANPEE